MKPVFRQQTERVHVEIRFDHHAHRSLRLHKPFAPAFSPPIPAGRALLREKRGSERRGEENALSRGCGGVDDAGDARDLEELPLRVGERGDVVGSAGNHVAQAEEEGERRQRVGGGDVRMQQPPGLVAVGLHEELVAGGGDGEFGGRIGAEKLAAEKTVADLGHGGRLRVGAAGRGEGVGDGVEEEGVVVVVAVLAVEHRIAHFVLELLPKTPLAVVSAVEAFLGIETLG